MNKKIDKTEKKKEAKKQDIANTEIKKVSSLSLRKRPFYCFIDYE